MSGELQTQLETGLTVVALIYDSDKTKLWTGSAFESISSVADANWADGAISCTEQQTSDSSGTGCYVGNWPSITTAGEYLVEYYDGAPSPGDRRVSIQLYDLRIDDILEDTGTTLLNLLAGTLDANVTQVSGVAVESTSGRIHAYKHDGTEIAAESTVGAISNTVRHKLVVPQPMEASTGTETYRIWLYLYDSSGNMEAPDSTPTLTAEQSDGTSLNAKLSSATNVSTGVYRWDYSVASTDEYQVIFRATITEGGVSNEVCATTTVVDSSGVAFGTSDRTKLEAIYNKLPSSSYLLGTSDAAGAMSLIVAGTINAAAIDADAITEAKISSGAISEIQNGLSTFDSASDKVTLADGAHGGSVATIELSDYTDFQGAAGGDVTVGGFTVDALKELAQTDTGLLLAASGSVAKLSQSDGYGVYGAGAIAYTVKVLKPDDSSPLQSCEVWVTSDEAGTTVVAGTLLTNSSGESTFMLDAGTYWFWRQHADYNFDTNPTQLTVS